MIAVALSFSLLFFISFTLISFRHKMPGGMSAALDKPMVQRLSAWVGFFGFIFGMAQRPFAFMQKLIILFKVSPHT